MGLGPIYSPNADFGEPYLARILITTDIAGSRQAVSVVGVDRNGRAALIRMRDH